MNPASPCDTCEIAPCSYVVMTQCDRLKEWCDEKRGDIEAKKRNCDWNTDGWIGWDMTQSMELKRMQSYEIQ